MKNPRRRGLDFHGPRRQAGRLGVGEISCLSLKDTKIIRTTAVQHYKAAQSAAQLLASAVAAAILNDV